MGADKKSIDSKEWPTFDQSLHDGEYLMFINNYSYIK